MRLHGGLSRTEPGLRPQFSIPTLSFGLAQERGGVSVSQFRLLIQLEMSSFRSYPNTGRAETRDGSLYSAFLTNDQREG